MLRFGHVISTCVSYVFMCLSVFYFSFIYHCAMILQCAHPLESVPNWYLFPLVSREILFFAKQSYQHDLPHYGIYRIVVELVLFCGMVPSCRFVVFFPARWHCILFGFSVRGLLTNHERWRLFSLFRMWFFLLCDWFKKKEWEWVVADFKVIAIEAALTMWWYVVVGTTVFFSVQSHLVWIELGFW